MKDKLKQGFLVGLGITTMAAGKVEKSVKEFLKEHDVNKIEAEKAANQFLKDAKTRQDKAVAALQREMKKAELHLKRHAAKATKKTVKKKRAVSKKAAVKRKAAKKRS